MMKVPFQRNPFAWPVIALLVLIACYVLWSFSTVRW